MSELRYLCLDCETSGLEPGKHAVIDVCLSILTFEWEEKGRLNLKIQFDASKHLKSPEAMNVNKIDIEEHNRTALRHDTAQQMIEEFFAAHAPLGTELRPGWRSKGDDAGNYLMPCGQQPSFDVNMLRGMFPTLRMPLRHQYYDSATLIELAIRRGALPKNFKSGLKNAAEYFGLGISKAHTAEGDVDFCLFLFREFDQIPLGPLSPITSRVNELFRKC
jgi:oligoribonuclease (3'-5' exoribonuclease)